LLYLLVHCELNNSVYFESALRSAVRSMQSAGRYQEFEKKFTAMLRKLTNTPVRERRKLIQSFFDELITLRTENNLQHHVFIAEALAWAKARAENLPLRSAVNYNPDL